MKKRIAIIISLLTIMLALSIPLATPALAWWEADTTVNIEGPPDPVTAGVPFTLIVTEANTGTYWLSDVWVSLTPGGYILDKASGYYYGGDTGDDGIMDPGETWEWRVNDVVISEYTCFEAIGHGLALGNPAWDVTWDVMDGDRRAFPNEKFVLCIDVTPPGGGEGLTPGYWKNHVEDWVGYGPDDLFLSIFTDPHGVISPTDMTMYEAVWKKGNNLNSLIRHAAAALLNAAHPNISYDLTEAEIISLVNGALDSGDYRPTKDILEGYNEQEGDINS